MLTAEATALLETVLAGSGRVLTDVRPVAAEADAVLGTVSGFEVATRVAGDPHDPPVTDLLYVARAVDDEAAGLVVADPRTGTRYRVWRYPDDPALPALAAAVHPDAAGVLLHRIGLGGAVPDVELVSYRPGRRAVIRVVQPSRTTYLKVLRPGQVAAVHERHQVLRAAGLPVPEPLGWSPAGLLLLAGSPGVPALEVLSAVAATDRLPRALRVLLDRLAALPRQWPARRTPVVAVDWYAAQLAGVAPALGQRAEAVGAAVRAAAPPAGCDTIHGDLHLGQVLVDPERPDVVLGLLDVDTAGPGHRGDDVSALVANVVTADLMAHDPAAAAAVETVGGAWPGLLAPPDALAELSVRLASQLLAHALGPATRGDTALADRVLGRAELALVDER